MELLYKPPNRNSVLFSLAKKSWPPLVCGASYRFFNCSFSLQLLLWVRRIKAFKQWILLIISILVRLCFCWRSCRFRALKLCTCFRWVFCKFSPFFLFWCWNLAISSFHSTCLSIWMNNPDCDLVWFFGVDLIVPSFAWMIVDCWLLIFLIGFFSWLL